MSSPSWGRKICLLQTLGVCLFVLTQATNSVLGSTWEAPYSTLCCSLCWLPKVLGWITELQWLCQAPHCQAVLGSHPHCRAPSTPWTPYPSWSHSFLSDQDWTSSRWCGPAFLWALTLCPVLPRINCRPFNWKVLHILGEWGNRLWETNLSRVT